MAEKAVESAGTSPERDLAPCPFCGEPTAPGVPAANCPFLGETGCPLGANPQSSEDDALAETIAYPGVVLAADDDGFPEVNTPEWDVMNRRRFELIQKKHREGLSPEEQAEYERLQGRTAAALAKAFPPDAAFSERLARIQTRLATEEPAGTIAGG